MTDEQKQAVLVMHEAMRAAMDAMKAAGAANISHPMHVALSLCIDARSAALRSGLLVAAE